MEVSSKDSRLDKCFVCIATQGLIKNVIRITIQDGPIDKEINKNSQITKACGLTSLYKAIFVGASQADNT